MVSGFFGQAPEQAYPRLGSLAQLVSVQSSTISNGADAGGRRIQIVNGALTIELLPDRGLDIGQVWLAGMPLAWVSGTGFRPPSQGDADGGGWLRGFGGGLLTTCGLLNYGPASEDPDGQHPQHGRYASLAAEVTRTEANEHEVIVAGTVREVTVFGAHLELQRTIRSAAGSQQITVSDTITNRGARPVAPMVLYHLNFGWPLIDDGTELHSPATRVTPRDVVAEAGWDSWSSFPALADTYTEQVFEHTLLGGGGAAKRERTAGRDRAAEGERNADRDRVAGGDGRGRNADGREREDEGREGEGGRERDRTAGHDRAAERTVEVAVVSPAGVAARVSFDRAQLPGLFQWRVAEPGLYVLGVEPATAPTIRGRADARARGLLTPLAPGASRMLGVQIALETGGTRIRA